MTGLISHLANGGAAANGGDWSTSILLVNADTHTASYQLNFRKEADGRNPTSGELPEARRAAGSVVDKYRL
jgi:hypothetical protein